MLRNRSGDPNRDADPQYAQSKKGWRRLRQPFGCLRSVKDGPDQ
jgi:hypothetical protein